MIMHDSCLSGCCLLFAIWSPHSVGRRYHGNEPSKHFNYSSLIDWSSEPFERCDLFDGTSWLVDIIEKDQVWLPCLDGNINCCTWGLKWIKQINVVGLWGALISMILVVVDFMWYYVWYIHEDDDNIPLVWHNTIYKLSSPPTPNHTRIDENIHCTSKSGDNNLSIAHDHWDATGVL